MKFAAICLTGAATLALGACEIHPRPAKTTQTAAAPATPVAQAEASPPVLDIPPAIPSASLLAEPVQDAVWAETPSTPQARRDVMIRAQVLLDRAHASPGVIDGQDGEPMRSVG